jgi:hypothetical protein
MLVGTQHATKILRRRIYAYISYAVILTWIRILYYFVEKSPTHTLVID